MKIASEVAAGLGQKPADLDLTGEELMLLSALLADDDEVGGFVPDISVSKFRPAVRGLVPGIPQGYTEVEWTY